MQPPSPQHRKHGCHMADAGCRLRGGGGGGCTLRSEGRRSAEEEGRPRPSVGFRSKSVLGEVGGRAQEGRGTLAGVAGRLAVLRRSEAVIHPYHARDSGCGTQHQSLGFLTRHGGMVRITPNHTCANPSQTVRRPDRPKAARGQKGKQVKVTRTKCKGSDFTVEMR